MVNHEITDENGNVSFTGVKAGEYTVTILKNNFDTEVITINVDADHLEFSSTISEHTATIYYCEIFESDGVTSLGDATVQTTGKEYNGYYEITVTDADDSSLIGEKYWISEEAVIDGTTLNELFEDFDGTSAEMFATISTNPKTVNLTITVKDESENPIEGAVISWE